MKRQILTLLFITCLFATMFFSLNIPSATALTSGTPVNTIAVVYGETWSASHSEFIADHFDFLVTDFVWAGYSPSTVKNYNPNIQIVGYMDLIGAGDGFNEAWYVHNLAGNRVKFFGGAAYLMDMSNFNWRVYWSNLANSALNTYSYFDGVFADDVWDELSVYVSWGMITDAITYETMDSGFCLDGTLTL
jgi:hypothetical protein